MGGKTSSTKGSVRKTNDKVDLKPLSRGGVGGGGASGGTAGASVCPLSFEVVLPESAKLADDTSLVIRNRDSHWFVIAAGQHVMSLRKDKSVMLTRCLEQGYRYRGTVTIRSKQRYGEFQRSS